MNIDSAEQARDPDEADQIENAETAKVESTDVERKRRPSRDIHPATLAWTSLVIQSFADKIQAVEREGTPARLRLALMKLLEDFSFRDQITRPIRSAVEDEELPQAMLNYNSLEALRRAFVAAIKVSRLLRPLVEHARSLQLQNSRRLSRKCEARLVRSRRFMALRIAVVCACWKRPMFAVCVFASCSLPDWLKAAFLCVPRAIGSIHTKSASV